MFAGDLAFAADHRVDPRRFDIPALRLDPWMTTTRSTRSRNHCKTSG